MSKAVCAFRVFGVSEVLDLSPGLYRELETVARRKDCSLFDLLTNACEKYGLSAEAVERFLIEDC